MTGAAAGVEMMGALDGLGQFSPQQTGADVVVGVTTKGGEVGCSEVVVGCAVVGLLVVGGVTTKGGEVGKSNAGGRVGAFSTGDVGRLEGRDGSVLGSVVGWDDDGNALGVCVCICHKQ